MLQTLLAARRLALHSQLCYRGSSRAACGAFAGKRNSRALSTEAAPVEDEGGDDVGDFGFHSAGQSTQQAWLTNLDGTKIGLINVSNFIFGAPYRQDILHQVVVWQLAKRRAGLAKVKGRSEVQGSTRKIAPQKGRGAARHGSIRAPIFVGGGRAHGPHPRSYDYTLPKKVRKLGLRVALSAKFAQGDLTFVDKVAVQTHKTKPLHEMLARRGLGKGCSALIVAGEEVDENLKRASLNLPYANVMASRGINVYDCLRHKKVVLSLDAVRDIEDMLAPAPRASAA